MLQLKLKQIKENQNYNKNKQHKFVNNGDRSKKLCAKILMNLKSKFYLQTSLRKKNIIGSYWLSDSEGVALK